MVGVRYIIEFEGSLLVVVSFSGPNCDIQLKDPAWESVSERSGGAGRASHAASVLSDTMWVVGGYHFQGANFSHMMSSVFLPLLLPLFPLPPLGDTCSFSDITFQQGSGLFGPPWMRRKPPRSTDTSHSLVS